MSNPHAEQAAALVESNSNGPTYLDPNTSGYAAAQVEALLALAYEQRTANLIAWVAAHGEDPSCVTVQIQERLGLA